MKKSFIFAVSLIFLGLLQGMAQRKEILLNDNWQFNLTGYSTMVEKVRVDLPHTWNAQDALTGDVEYHRGIGSYEKTIKVPDDWKGRRVFLRFEGANTVTDVFVNGRHAGRHKGGYGAFNVEVTDYLDYGKNNDLLVRVNNGETLEVMPLSGDFNHYGGIYRDVHIVVTGKVGISMLDHGSCGVRLVQDSVSRDHADVRAMVSLANGSEESVEATLRLRLSDGEKEVLAVEKPVILQAGCESLHELPFSLDEPRLWDGRNDPFRYKVEIMLCRNGEVLDVVEQRLGLRFYDIDPDKGFFLNGKHLQLHGVCRHQDRADVANALRREHHDEDAALMSEMGVNAVRLAHYPHSAYFYELMDSLGMVVWAEIPFVGPQGFVDIPEFKENGREQLVEMIRQHYNHPSICVWGLFNELDEAGNSPVPYLKELNDLAHAEDPTRLTTAASNIDSELNFVTDVMAWNRYDGWYGNMPADLGKWLDDRHSRYPGLCIAISEYGAGASIYHQQDSVVKSVPVSWWHPENWQTRYHIENWRELSARRFVWGSFVWNMFDFAAAHRREGDRPGINDKGLVTYDRKVKKDAFYFYKANWNKEEPVLYLAGRRNTHRTLKKQTFMAFTNQPEAELIINGHSMGKAKADGLCTATWHDVELSPGENVVTVISGTGKKRLTDTYRCYLQD